MDFIGKVILDLPLEEGVSKANNPWRKKCWVLETFGNYPKKVKVDAFNAGVDNVKMEIGKVYNVSVDAESREFNGRWYTDLRVYAARETTPDGMPGQSQPVSAAPVADPFQSATPAANPFSSAAPESFKDQSDDLPF